MAEIPDFQKKQYAFAAHIRDPDNVAAPEGIEDRRMGVYRRLFFNNLRNLLGGMFPVIRKIHTDEQWDEFIRQFMQRHDALTPYFLELPQEFLAFLQSEYKPGKTDFPFLVELAHYEYVEIALSISEDEDDLEDIDPDGDLLEGTPVKSVLAWVFAYSFPVHRISADYLPERPSGEPVCIAVYRRADDEVAFLELNAVTARLVNDIENNDAGLSGKDLLRGLAADIEYANVDALLEHGRQALDEMRALGILIGTRKQ